MNLNEFDVDINLYKLFYVVVKSGNFSKAAETLNVTQPSVSYNIKKLENDLGIKLFERGTNLTLTSEGEALLPYIESALFSIKNGEREVNDLINLKKGQINIGVPSHIGVFLLADILKRFIKLYPDIKVKVVSKSTKELNRLLYLNELDVIIDSSPLEENLFNFVIKKISREKCAFACNKRKNDLLGRKLKLKDLENETLIVPLLTSSTTKSLIPIYKEHHMVFDPQFEISTSDMIAEMVEKNMGIGFLFEKTIDTYPSLEKMDVDIVLPNFDIFVLYKEATLSITTSEFIRFLESKIDNI